MWPPMCQTEVKDHFAASAVCPVGNNHPGCGWLEHHWLIFHLLSTGTLRSVSVKLLCSSIGIWGYYILECRAAIAFVAYSSCWPNLQPVEILWDLSLQCATTPSNLVLPVDLPRHDTIPAGHGIVDHVWLRWACHPPYSLYLISPVCL